MQNTLAAQQAYFASGETLKLSFRRAQLMRLQASIEEAADDIYAALKADLGKCELEAYVSELALIHTEIKQALKHLPTWSRARRAKIPLPFWPATGRVVLEPLGVVLIISPWNYPFQLALGPLVSAIAAGNCAVIKPSEIAPETSSQGAKLIAKTFSPHYITV